MSMNLSQLTNTEISHLCNALTLAINYSRKQLPFWTEMAEKNLSATACVKMTELEISNYSDLLKKIQSIRGF